MNRIPHIKYVTLVWKILDVFFERNPEHRAAFIKAGKSTLYAEVIALDAYYYIVEEYLKSEAECETEKFKNIRVYIFREEEDKIKTILSNAKEKLPGLDTERYKELSNKLQTSRKSFYPEGLMEGQIGAKKIELGHKDDKTLLVSKLMKEFLNEGIIPVTFAEEDKATKLSLTQLDLLSIYAFKMDFSNFISKPTELIRSKTSVNLIPTKISLQFCKTLSQIIKAFEDASANKGSKLIMESQLDQFAKKIEVDLKNLVKGKLVLNIEDYLEQLKQYIEKCSLGIGVTVPKWAPNFKKKVGLEILKINQKQYEKKYEHFRGEKYMRIFFLDSESSTKLKEEEKNILKKQLNCNVEVYVIFISDVINCFPDEYDGDMSALDFALLRIEDKPIIADSFVEDDIEKNKGMFHRAKDIIQKYYEIHLEGIIRCNDLRIYELKENMIFNEINRIQRRGIEGYINDIIKE